MHDLKERHYELCWKRLLTLWKGEVVGIENGFLIAVHNHQPERLLSAMILVFPLEVRSGSQVNFEATSGERLRIRLDLNTRHVVHKFV